MTAVPEIDWTDVDSDAVPTTSAVPAANGRKPRPAQPALDTTPPHDNNAERAVLGAALLQPALIPELAGILRDDDWYHPAHTAIWTAVTDLAATGQPIDVHNVGLNVGTDRTLTSLGGPLYISDLTNAIPTTSSATYYARIVAARASERRTVELGTWLTQAGHNGTERAQIEERVNRHLTDRNPADKAAASSWSPVDLEDALAGTEDDNKPTLMPRSDGAHLLYPGAVHMLSGEPTSGKTWIALHTAVDQLNQGRNVCIIDFEDRAARVVERLLLIGATPDNIRRHLRYIRPYDGLDAGSKAILAKAVTDTTLVIIDGVTEAMTLHGLDLSSNPDVATFYALLPRWVANHDTTVVLIDHVVKDTERQGRWSIGGQHKVAGIDGAAYTVKCTEPFGRGRRGSSRLIISKDRHGHVEEIALGRTAAEFHLDSTDPHVSIARLDPPEAMPTSEGGDMRPTFLMESVSKWLEYNPGSTLNAVKTAVHGKASYVAKALQQLVIEGHVDAQPGLRGAIFHRVITPFRNDEEASE